MGSRLEKLFAKKSPSEIVDELSIRFYKSPLSKLRDRLPDLPAAIRIPMLVIDFNTEVEMQGILGFLENSTGMFLNDTIDAFVEIGAMQTAKILAHIRTIMASYGVTPADLRADFDETTEIEVTSFEKLHGEDRSSMASEVDSAADALYLNRKGDEDVWGLLDTFVAKNKSELIDVIRDAR